MNDAPEGAQALEEKAAETSPTSQEQQTVSEKAPKRWRSNPWTLRIGIAAAMALIAAGIATKTILSRTFDPRRTALGESLASAVPDYLVLLDRASSSPTPATVTLLAKTRLRATSASVQKELGAEGTKRLGQALDAAAGVAGTDTENPKVGSTDPFFAAVGELDAALASQKLSYFVDADISVAELPLRTQPLLFSFYIERESQVLTEAGPVRALALRRLDQLRVRQSFLGYTRPRAGAALILLDQIETDLVTHVLPAIPAGETMQMLDDQSLEDLPETVTWPAELQTRVAEIVRIYVNSGAPTRVSDITRLGTLLARRRTLVRKWRSSVAGLGLKLHVPERLIPEADYAADLGIRVPREELREWEEIHDELQSSTMVRAFLTLRDRYAADVQRHEVQHRIDYLRGLVPVPDALVQQLGNINPLDAPATSLAGRSRDELSAFLAQLASTEDSPMLTLVLLGRFVFDETELGGAYAYAGFVAVDEIARELQITTMGPLTAPGHIVRSRMAERFEAVLTHTPEEIRDAACKVWARLYGAPLGKVSTGSVTEHEPWRH